MDRHKVVYMHYADNRRAEVATKLLESFNGYLQTDGYTGYNDVVKDNNIIQLTCWAHARRKFVDIIKSCVSDTKSKAYAQEAITFIQKLYKIEREIKDEPPDKKYLIRQERPYYYLKYLMTEQLPYYQRDNRDIEPLLPWNIEGEDIVKLA